MRSLMLVATVALITTLNTTIVAEPPTPDRAADIAAVDLPSPKRFDLGGAVQDSCVADVSRLPRSAAEVDGSKSQVTVRA